MEIDRIEALDAPARLLTKLTADRHGRLLTLSRGRLLGHPLHPALTDVTVGFWTASWWLDLVGGRGSAAASRKLIGWGVVSVLPTALAGLGDVPALEARDRRVAVVHAASNTVATALYGWSWVARRNGRRGTGIAIGMAAAGVATVGGLLGGRLAFGHDAGGDDDDSSGNDA
jgi:uncharacterized membrane protein